MNFEDVVLDYKVHMVASKMQRICSSWNWTVCWFHGNVWSLGDYYSDYPAVSIGIMTSGLRRLRVLPEAPLAYARGLDAEEEPLSVIHVLGLNLDRDPVNFEPIEDGGLEVDQLP